MKNTLSEPLKLSWISDQYKVNKHGDQSGEYVDKAIAAELLEALKAAHQVILVLSEDTNTALVKQIENVISKAE